MDEAVAASDRASKVTAVSGNSHLLRNSAWNTAAFLFNAGLNLGILPFVLFKIGSAAFGVAGLVTACIVPALTFSQTIGQSTTRELALRLSLDQRGEARRFFAAALFLAAAGGLPVAILLATGGPQIAGHVFHLDGELARDLPPAFAFGAGGWLCQCVAAIFVAIFTARQHYARVAAITVAGVVVSAVSTLVFVPSVPKASTFIGCQALGSAAALATSVALSRQFAAEWLAWPAWHREPLRRLLSIGGWQFVAQGSGTIAGQADRYLLGAFLAPQFVGYYTIAQRLEEAVYIGILKIGEILFPFFSSLHQAPRDRIADVLFRACWIMNLLAACALGALIPVAGPLLQAWTTREVAAQAQALLVVLAVAGILGSASNVFAYYLLAKGRTHWNALIAIVTAAATLITSAAALPMLGWQAAGWSACAGMAAQIVLTTILLRRSFDLADTWPRVVHFVLQPLVTGIVVALGLRYAAAALLDRVTPWWCVAFAYGLVAIIIFAAVVAVSALGPYGATCWKDLRRVASRLKPGKAL